MAAVHPSRMGLVPGPSALPSSSSLPPRPPSASREENLRRQLLERRQAKEGPANNGVSGGISIKWKGKKSGLIDRIGGMRAWDEVPLRDAEVQAEVQERQRRQTSEESIPAYPRSPSPRRPPRQLRDERPDRSMVAPPSYGRARAASPVPRAVPARVIENPQRRAMREGYDLPPHPHRRDPHRDQAYIHAEPMRRPDPVAPRDRRPSPSYTAQLPGKPDQHRPAQEAGPSGTNETAGYGYGAGRHDLPGSQQGNMPWRDQIKGGWQNPPRRFNGPVDFEQRRLQRETSTLTVWPPSPTQPYRDEAEIEADHRAARKAAKAKGTKRSKHRSRYSSASSSGSDTDSSEEERRARRRKREKRRKYASSESDSASESRGGERDKRQRRRSVTITSSSDDSEADDVDKRKKRKSQSKSKSKSRARSMGEEEWVEKGDTGGKGKSHVEETPLSLEDLARMQRKRKEEEEVIGPVLPHDAGLNKVIHRQRYEDMRPGEAEAMALYASNGLRIPRRGEIGLDTDRIATFEDSGYVMSGARHKKMNAVRLRKENQVINAEEKRAILNLQREEKIKREGMIVSQFRELMNTSLQRHGG